MTSPASGSAPTTGSPVPRMVARRREANSNPLVQRQKRPRAPVANRPKPATPTPTPPSAAAPAKTAASTAPSSSRAGGTIPAEDEGEWHEFKLTTTKASLLKGLRHHVMRMQSKREIDPTDPSQFTRPVRLHRRDPRAPLQGAKEEAAANQLAAANKAAEAGGKVKDEVEQAKKDAEKQANLDKIAPFGGAQKQKQKVFHKKTQQVFKSNDAEKKLRYEEFFPWFIEDFDNKNTWQGQLESSLSKGVFAMFVLEEGAFRMVPIEKWYKFQEKNRFPTMTSEEAELEMKKNARPPRWLMKRTEEKESKQRELEENARANKTLFTRKGDRLKGEADNDDLDFEDDQFADDEETPIMEGEEQENKEIEKRIKKEQLSANFFDARDERDWEKEELERKKLEEVRRKHGKKVRKALMTREGNFTYESDSDENPYDSAGEEESEGEEETARKEEEKKKEEERKKAEAAAEKEKADLRKSKTPPVATPTSSSTATPSSAAVATTVAPTSQAKSKATVGASGGVGGAHSNVANKKDKHQTGTPLPPSDKKPQLKRAGTPSHPESGTESRKKPKKNAATNNGTTTTTTGKSTTLPILGGADKKNIVKLKVAGESLSQIASSTPSPSPPPPGGVSTGSSNKKRKADMTGGARSGDERSGEMSDGPGSKKQRIKIAAGGAGGGAGRSLSPAAAAAVASRQGTPGASRAGSPAAAATANTSAPAAARGTPGPPDFITDAEIRTVLSSNPEGVTLKFIADKFKNRVRNEEVKKGLVSSLRRLSVSTDKRTYKLKEGVGA
ncbi:hypothetical protein L873DRAFT_1735403 [Choiromyces venosus 120613-1]|uniref:Uncharacterized protein n=1 Tax=Choiromyces venosus 120613-1 TaxID=1336337 RepID=A0A3N4JVL5_9PEZI|nr:hypothetical protein L873DRAFT_1735403 [Choiromyces venosus 120613-1]